MGPIATLNVNRLGKSIRLTHWAMFADYCAALFNLGAFPINLISDWAFDRPGWAVAASFISLVFGTCSLFLGNRARRRKRWLQRARHHVMLADYSGSIAAVDFHIEQANAALDQL